MKQFTMRVEVEITTEDVVRYIAKMIVTNRTLLSGPKFCHDSVKKITKRNILEGIRHDVALDGGYNLFNDFDYKQETTKEFEGNALTIARKLFPHLF